MISMLKYKYGILQGRRDIDQFHRIISGMLMGVLLFTILQEGKVSSH